MWAVIKDIGFPCTSRTNKLIPWVNDWNVIKFEDAKKSSREKEKNWEIESFSDKIRNLVSEIISEISIEWIKNNWLYKIYSPEWLKNLQDLGSALNDKMLIEALLMSEAFHDSENRTQIHLSDEEKLLQIKQFLIERFRKKIEDILNENSLN